MDLRRAAVGGRPGAVREVVTSALRFAGIEIGDPGGPEGEGASIVVLVLPTERDWDAAARYQTPVLVVERGSPTPAEVVAALMRGADAVIGTDAGLRELLDTASRVARREAVLHGDVARRLVAASRYGPTNSSSTDFSSLELAVLSSIARGESTRQGVARLGVSRSAVDHATSRLLRKLGARNRAQAVVRAHDLGLLSEDGPDT